MVMATLPSTWAVSRDVAAVMTAYGRERRTAGRLVGPELGGWLYRLGREGGPRRRGGAP